MELEAYNKAVREAAERLVELVTLTAAGFEYEIGGFVVSVKRGAKEMNPSEPANTVPTERSV